MDNAAVRKQGSSSSPDHQISLSSLSRTMLLPNSLGSHRSSSSRRPPELDYQTTCSSGSASGVSSPTKETVAAALELPPTPPCGMTPRAHLQVAPPSPLIIDETTPSRTNDSFEPPESPQQQHYNNDTLPHQEEQLNLPTSYNFPMPTVLLPQEHLQFSPPNSKSSLLFAQATFPSFPKSSNLSSAAAALSPSPHYYVSSKMTPTDTNSHGTIPTTNSCKSFPPRQPPPSLLQLVSPSSEESPSLENSENSVPNHLLTASLLSELLLNCNLDNYNLKNHLMPDAGCCMAAAAAAHSSSFSDTGNSTLTHQLRSFAMDDDNSNPDPSSALSGCLMSEQLGATTLGNSCCCGSALTTCCCNPAMLDFSSRSPNRLLSFLLQAAALEQITAAAPPPSFAATAPPMLQQQQENHQLPRTTTRWPPPTTEEEEALSPVAASRVAHPTATPFTRTTAAPTTTASFCATEHLGTPYPANRLDYDDDEDNYADSALAPLTRRHQQRLSPRRLSPHRSPRPKSPCKDDNPRLKIRLKRQVHQTPGGSSVAYTAAVPASEGPTFWGMWEDERDRMVYVSWLPRSGRASDRQTKKRCELILKDFIQNMLGFTGLEKVLLFPPRSAHCKLLFEGTTCAERFLAVFGGSTLGPALWKIFVCRRFGVDIKDGIQSTRVKIIWADQTKNNHVAATADDTTTAGHAAAVGFKNGFPSHDEVLAGLSVFASGKDSAIAAISAHLMALLIQPPRNGEK